MTKAREYAEDGEVVKKDIDSYLKFKAGQEARFKDKADLLKYVTQEVERTTDEFLHDSLATVLFEQGEQVNLDQALYLCFLEVVRQVSANSKA